MTLNLTMSDDLNVNPLLLSPLNLAFVGDAVFDLLAREYYVAQANRPVGTLHSLCAGKVCAGSQAKAAAAIAEHLTQEEKDILRRGRNAHTSHTPKNSSGEDYHLATGFECLIGFLYLSGRNERIAEIFDAVRKTWLD